MMRRPACVLVAAAALALTGCGSSGDSPQEIAEASITDPPVIASWSDVNGVRVPLGATDGPATGAWAPFTGFSHTPQGAGLAAITQSVQLSTATDNSWAKALSVLTAPGGGRDEYAANRALISVTGPVDPAVAPTIVGYVVADYSDTAAAIDVVQRFPDNSLASTRSTVVWVGDDWKLDLPTPEQAVPATVLTELPADVIDLEGTRK